MSIEDFNNTKWTGGMSAKYQGKIYDVVSCDFLEKTVCIECNDSILWVDCIDVELIK